MWISKKKFDQKIAEAVEKEQDRGMMYRFMEDTNRRCYDLENRIDKIETRLKIGSASNKRSLNG